MFGFKKKAAVPAYLELSSPIPGSIVPLDNVEDEAFSTKAMGEGFAVDPAEGKVFAPFDGTVVHVMEKSKHALMLEHKSGVQILIHVGMNTVSLKGEGFTAHVSTGQKIKKGDLLLEFDMKHITGSGYSVVTPVVVPAGQEIVKDIEMVNGDQQEAVLRIHY